MGHQKAAIHALLVPYRLHLDVARELGLLGLDDL